MVRQCLVLYNELPESPRHKDSACLAFELWNLQASSFCAMPAKPAVLFEPFVEFAAFQLHHSQGLSHVPELIS
jgi:hypothetical protein